MAILHRSRNLLWTVKLNQVLVLRSHSRLFATLPTPKSTSTHTPVLCTDVVKYLNPSTDSLILDMTFGGGGHSKALLEKAHVKIVGLDRDPVAHKLAVGLSKTCPDQVIPLLGKFSDLPTLLSEQGIKENSFDGVLLDLGCSSMQFDEATRGFASSLFGPLDMRMGGASGPDQITAADVLSHAEEYDLYKIFKVYGEEKNAKKIARAIIEARYSLMPLKTTADLANLVAGALDQDARRDKLSRRSHVATKVFQALRIFINDELNEIDYGMLLAHRYLKEGGVLVAISFHSLEDRIIKRHIAGNADDRRFRPLKITCSEHGSFYTQEGLDTLNEHKWHPLNTKVVVPSDEELHLNPRSRSAKLRAAVKL